MTTLQYEFEWVRRTFFPTWDRKRRWRLLVVPNRRANVASCDRVNKRIIFYGPVPDNPAGLRAFFIVSIVHALSPHQGPEYHQRIDRARVRAHALGQTRLAYVLECRLRKHVRRLIASSVHHCPFRPSFSGIEGLTATLCDMPLEDFRAAFPWARQVFDSSLRKRDKERRQDVPVSGELVVVVGKVVALPASVKRS